MAKKRGKARGEVSAEDRIALLERQMAVARDEIKELWYKVPQRDGSMGHGGRCLWPGDKGYDAIEGAE